ncbi:hypothetical protein ACOMHN_014033 [Nucella lapillus]
MVTNIMAAAHGEAMVTCDDDDFLGAIFMSENRCQDEGFQEGQADGRQKGLQEGFRLGCQKGCEMGTELGFYVGFAETIRQRADGLKNKERVLKSIGSLLELIELFPLTDPHNIRLQDQIQAIRAKFKQVTSLIHIRTQTQFSAAGESHGASF